jgi:integral membrane protein MviN
MGNADTINKKAIIGVVAITLLSKIFGFARDMVLAYYYGASSVTDAYLVSITIPELLFALVTQAIAVGFIPIFTEIIHKEGQEKADKFTNNILTIMYALCGIVVCLTNLFPHTFVNIVAKGFDEPTTTLAIQFVRVTVIVLFLKGTVTIFSAYAQAKGEFTRPALIGLPLDIVIILFTAISYYTNSILLAYGMVVASAAQLLVIAPFVYKQGFRLKICFNFKDSFVIKMIMLFLPVSIGVGANQINILIDRTLASTLAVGGISAINYANKVGYIMDNVIVLSIVAVMYPSFSKMVAEQNMEGFRQMIEKTIQMVILLMVPISVGAILFSQPIIRLLFGRGAFDENAIIVTASVMSYFSVGMLAVSLRSVLTRAFYALQDIRTPIINSCVAIVINIALNLILSRFMGLNGLALATSISSIICVIMMLYSFDKKVGNMNNARIILNLLKVMLASAIMGVAAYFSYYIASQSMGDFYPLILATIVCVIIYLPLVIALKVDGFKAIVIIYKGILIKYTNLKV